MDKMNKNADEIAASLSSANPNWPKAALLSALAAHGGYHMAEVDAINVKDFSSEAKTWEAMKTQVDGIGAEPIPPVDPMLESFSVGVPSSPLAS
jgi:hypothetical protein